MLKKRKKKVRSHLTYTIELLIFLVYVREIFPLIIVAFASPYSLSSETPVSIFSINSLNGSLLFVSLKTHGSLSFLSISGLRLP